MGVFVDPLIKRIASVEDWLELLYREIKNAEDRTPVGAAGWELRHIEAVAAAKKAADKAAAQPNKRVDVRAELKRRQDAAARGEYSETAGPSLTRSSNSKAQAGRDEIARRIAAANSGK